MLGDSGAYASSPEKIRKMWWSPVLQNSLKINIFIYKTHFYIKKNIYYIHVGIQVCYGVPKASCDIFENLLQLKRFGLYFEGFFLGVGGRRFLL